MLTPSSHGRDRVVTGIRLVPAKCPECGGSVSVDMSGDVVRGECSRCEWAQEAFQAKFYGVFEHGGNAVLLHSHYCKE
jgi:hypothetical protein